MIVALGNNRQLASAPTFTMHDLLFAGTLEYNVAYNCVLYDVCVCIEPVCHVRMSCMYAFILLMRGLIAQT